MANQEKKFGKKSDGQEGAFFVNEQGMDGDASKVSAPSDYQGVTTSFENTDVIDTRDNPATQPTGGARVVTMAFIDKGAAVATELYVVFNATDDSDAATKLAAAATRSVITIGERRTWTVSLGNEITRIDFMSDDPTPVGGSNKVAGEYVV